MRAHSRLDDVEHWLSPSSSLESKHTVLFLMSACTKLKNEKHRLNLGAVCIVYTLSQAKKI